MRRGQQRQDSVQARLRRAVMPIVQAVVLLRGIGTHVPLLRRAASHGGPRCWNRAHRARSRRPRRVRSRQEPGQALHRPRRFREAAGHVDQRTDPQEYPLEPQRGVPDACEGSIRGVGRHGSEPVHADRGRVRQWKSRPLRLARDCLDSSAGCRLHGELAGVRDSLRSGRFKDADPKDVHTAHDAVPSDHVFVLSDSQSHAVRGLRLRGI
mmetsp:Transcript_9775/g.25092  ORF Transcript_9775/g.25092 Transcript_9775/m.25092 type:complete len:210 (+) Transcript_9775:3638-4267(+)